MAKVNRATARKLFSSLLDDLRKELIDCPAIYFAEIFGSPDEKVTRLLMHGICGDADKYWSFGNLPDDRIMVLYGNEANAEDGIDRLQKYAERICNAIEKIQEGDRRLDISPSNDKPGVRAAIVGLLVKFLVELLRAKEPESLSLPAIVAGKLVYSSGYFVFPSGRSIEPAYMVADNAAYTSAYELASQGKISITLLTTPVVQAAANVARYISESYSRNLPKTQRKRAASVRQFVKLSAPDGNPIVNGKQKPILATREYSALKALVDAKRVGQNRLTCPELDSKSGVTDARKVLRLLADRDKDYRAVLLFPKRKGEGYGVR